VEIDNLRTKSTSTGTKSTAPLVQRLFEYPIEGVDLENLVTYPPKVEPIPVKPLFFDVAWNYIDYPGKVHVAANVEDSEERPDQQSGTQKRGWFGFGRS
jgi:signal recognition particle subunit SRP68